MSSFLDIRLPAESLSVRWSEDYSQLLRRTADPRVQLRRFESGLRGTAMGRAHELHAPEAADVRVAIDVLGARLRGARQHLIREAVDEGSLSDYLACSMEIAREQVVTSGSAAELADTVTGVLDGLHSYLVAHNLVDDAYLTAERAVVARVMTPRSMDMDPVQKDRPAERAARNELAIAA